MGDTGVLAAWLVAVGACDLLRAAKDATTRTRRWLVVVIGVLLLVVVLGGAYLSLWPMLWLTLGLSTLLAVWVHASAAALVGRHRPGVVARRWTAAVALGLGTAVAVLSGGVVPDGTTWPAWLQGSVVDRWQPGQVLLVAGVLLVQVSTANVVVRLVLDAVGVPATSGEKQLKGGRLLGPLERVFVVGLGAAGEVTAAAVVAAAKGLLRWPELQRGQQESGPTDVTEYFLIGTFTSWLLSLAGVAALALV